MEVLWLVFIYIVCLMLVSCGYQQLIHLLQNHTSCVSKKNYPLLKWLPNKKYMILGKNI